MPLSRLSQVAITFNSRTYRFECGAADVERLEQLANYLKTKLDTLMAEHGAIGDERLVLMAALTLADELFDARADIDELLDDQTDQLKAVAKSAASKTPAPEPDAIRKAGG